MDINKVSKVDDSGSNDSESNDDSNESKKLDSNKFDSKDVLDSKDHSIEEYNQFVWKIIDQYFESHPKAYVQHHIDSYNHFMDSFIQQTFEERNPVIFQTGYDEERKEYRHTLRIYFGGKDGKQIYFGKPIIYDKSKEHYMFPNEARLRNMTYATTIHYDVFLEYEDIFYGDQELYKEPPSLGNMIKTTFEKNSVSETVIEDYTEENNQSIRRQPSSEAFKSLIQKDNEDLDRQTRLPPVEDEQPDSNDEEEGQRGGGPKKKVPQQLLSLNTQPPVRSADQQVRASDQPVSRTVVRKVQNRSQTIEKVLLGRIPMMVQSKYCVLHGLPPMMRYGLGECKNEPGGYFIIDGKEKCIIPQEKFADNVILLKKYETKVGDDEGGEEEEEEVKVGATVGGQPKYSYSAEIRSVSENISKPIRTLRIGLMHPTTRYSFENMVVELPNVRSPVPLFVVFRALGILSDRAIMEMCLLDLEKYQSMMDKMVPSVHDASMIYTQEQAVHFISLLLKHKSEIGVHRILTDFLFPHIGETNYYEKALFLGHMVFRLLSMSMGLEPPTDRDNYKNKRLETTGILLSELFRHSYAEEQRVIRLGVETIYNYNKEVNQDLAQLMTNNYRDIFGIQSWDQAFRRAFKGRWGEGHEARVGIVQDLNRLSFLSALSHLRKINLPIDSKAKLVGPRVLSGNSWGFLDPIDTPDGANVGLHKTMATMTVVSQTVSRKPIIEWIRAQPDVYSLQGVRPGDLATMCKVIVNGYWCASTSDPVRLVETFKDQRRIALIPYSFSIQFSITQKTVFVSTDGGRMLRPIFYAMKNTAKAVRFSQEMVMHGSRIPSWNEMMMGTNSWILPQYDPTRIYSVLEAYGTENMASLLSKRALLEYVDASESENALICMNYFHPGRQLHGRWTHCEIHESLLYGLMSSLVLFLEHNPVARDSFSCVQSKQAISLFHSNYGVRLDKTGLLLQAGQIPLVKTRYYDYICHEEHPYGVNAMVAIMSYTGYNVEDSILISRGALERGLFRTTYYTTYELHEEEEIRQGRGIPTGRGAQKVIGDQVLRTVAMNVLADTSIVGMKAGYDYSYLDERGLVREGTVVHDKMIMIGMVSTDSNDPTKKVDHSKAAKKGQLGVVDKAFITADEEGRRIIKIRIREERQPNLGDKLAGRAGQKGTVGLILEESDMPTTAAGVRPDLIINPHAIPSRMTIGQLVECVLGKISVLYGGFSDCTAFNVRGNKIAEYGAHLSAVSKKDLQEELRTYGFHSSGNEIMYNGFTGQQCEADIFFGPMYYMRLKHMVKDKINFRADGPNNVLTRQPVGGRANDGGLRIGEMERDSVASHGMAYFLKESMMERADKYYMAVCQTTGFIAICNPDTNLWLSPAADGPVHFDPAWSRLGMTKSYVKQVSKFGRTFSLVEIPYALKLLMQEMMAANVSMRIITEESMTQKETMAFRSDNIAKLTGLPEPVLASDFEEMVRGNNQKNNKDLNQVPSIQIPSKKSMNRLNQSIQSIRSNQTIPVGLNKTLQESALNPSNELNETTGLNSKNLLNPSNQLNQLNEPTNVQAGGGARKVHFDTTPVAIDTASMTSMASMGNQLLTKAPYMQGDLFYLRGDTKSNRVWKLTKPGDRFMRIETEDHVGLKEGEEVRVVSEEDIISVSSMPMPMQMTQPPVGIFDLGQSVGQGLGQNVGQGLGQGILPMNNNIEIHVIQGDDKSQKIGSDKVVGPNPNGLNQTPLLINPTGSGSIGSSTLLESSSNSSVEQGDLNKGPVIIKKIE